jgi:hypothetical protein
VKKTIIAVALLLPFFSFSCFLDYFELDIVKPVPVGSSFKVKYGQTVQVNPGAMRITFSDVLGDSRCPLDVVCVWAGVADIFMKFEIRGSRPISDTLHIGGYIWEGSVARHHTVEAFGYNVTLLQLDPYPKMSVPRNYKEYVATLKVEKKL